MQRNDSLPRLDANDRGRGLADIKGADPMDRRVEVEKKAQYAQALREQMAGDADRRRTASRDDDGASHPGTPMYRPSSGSCGEQAPGTPSWGGAAGGGLPRVDHSPSVMRRSRCSTPLMTGGHGTENAHTSDKVAEVQEVMRQRLQMLQDEQHRQWQAVQAALQGQMGAAREMAQDLAERAVQQQLEGALRQLEAAKADLRAAGDRQAAALHEAQGASAGLAGELADLRQAVERLQEQGGQHHNRLEAHGAEIERLKRGHEECHAFRAEIQGAVAQLQRDCQDALGQVHASRAEMQRFGSEIDRLHAARQEDHRAFAELANQQRASAELLAQLRAEVGDVPNLLRKLRDEVPRIAKQAAREAAEGLRAPSPAPAPQPPPRPPSPPKDVSPEAYAVLRGQDGELYELPQLRNTVGRNAQCDACVAASQAVSNKHASVDFDREGRAHLKDAGSRNGTFLNEKRVPQDSSVFLQSGDAVKLGVDGPTLLFEFGPAYYARWPSNFEHAGGRHRGSGGRLVSQ